MKGQALRRLSLDERCLHGARDSTHRRGIGLDWPRAEDPGANPPDPQSSLFSGDDDCRSRLYYPDVYIGRGVLKCAPTYSASLSNLADKFKPSSIPPSASGTYTPSSSLTSSLDPKEVQIHLQASSSHSSAPPEIHGFNGKIDPSTSGGLRKGWREGEKEGAGGKDVVLVWDEGKRVRTTWILRMHSGSNYG